MVETILLAFIAAKLKKLDIKPIFRDWAIYPVLFFAVLYIFLQAMVFLGDYSLVKYTNIYKTSYLLSFLFLIIRYKQYIAGFAGAISVIIGTWLNNIVIAANGGKMPVFPTLSYITGYMKPSVVNNIDNVHILGSETTKLSFLSDIFDVGYSVMSIGDIIVRAYAFIVIYFSIKYICKLNSYGSKEHHSI